MTITPERSPRQLIMEQNRRDFSAIYSQLAFPAPAVATAATKRREQLLALINSRGAAICGGTKPFSGQLSPGCRICTQGAWSCLFINGRCNRSCFYCPTSQDAIGLPTTNNITFRSPADYVAYLQQFHFRGMSLSGGEPLLTPGRSLAFLTAAKRRFGSELHSWLYTNGSLVDENILLRLRDAGLDEIRFDIGALGYSLDKAALAVKIIPTVTVEIPAVPEQLELLKQRLCEMAECGIKHLNLHQLRLTNYNYQRLAKRPYTYLHGPKITVLESELTALELVAYSLEQQLPVGVNYCSFAYKNRYQQAAARGRGADLFRQSWETATTAGFLRSLELGGQEDSLNRVAAKLRESGAGAASWTLATARQSLAFAAELAPLLAAAALPLRISYAATPVHEALSYRNPFHEVRLPSTAKIFAERVKTQTFTLEGSRVDTFLALLNRPDEEKMAGLRQLFPEIAPYEQPERGLQDYF